MASLGSLFVAMLLLSAAHSQIVSSGTYGKFYARSSLWLNHSGAKAACVGEKGTLATIKARHEWKAIEALVPRNWQLHIGLDNPNLETCRNADCTGKLIWSDNTTFVWDSDWMGELAVYADSSSPCLILVWNGFNAWSCNTVFGHVCQFVVTVKA